MTSEFRVGKESMQLSNQRFGALSDYALDVAPRVATDEAERACIARLAALEYARTAKKSDVSRWDQTP